MRGRICSGRRDFLSAVDFVQADRMRRKVAVEMARVFGEVDLLLVPSLRDEILTITNFTGHPSLTLRAGFVEVSEARSDWAPDPKNPLPKFSPPRRVPHGVTLIGPLVRRRHDVLGRASRWSAHSAWRRSVRRGFRFFRVRTRDECAAEAERPIYPTLFCRPISASVAGSWYWAGYVSAT